MEISAVSSAVLSSVAMHKPHECACDDHQVSPGKKLGHEIGRGAAMQAFRAELRMSLKAHFHAVFGASQAQYAENHESSPEDVADEALAVAKNVAAQSPESAAESMIRFRSSVEESVQVASQYVQSDADQSDLDVATAKIDAGVSEIEEEAASTAVSSASALAVDTSTKQRSVIKIRTQEGDLVRLSLRQVSDLTASSAEVVDGNFMAQSTEVEYSSSSRMFVRVQGDLNEAEMGAIQNVLAQAQEMADAFYGGDIGAAFASASGFEFDTEQLARVKMRFRMQQETNIAYAQVGNPVAAPVVEEPVATPVITAATPDVVEAAEPLEDVVPVVEEPAAPVVPDDAMQGFFELVGNFLRSVSEGFVEGAGSASVRYHYSESFKLSLLQSVINTVAPDDSGDASGAAVELIDQISESE